MSYIGINLKRYELRAELWDAAKSAIRHKTRNRIERIWTTAGTLIDSNIDSSVCSVVINKLELKNER